MIKWLRTMYKERLRRFSACCNAMDESSYEQLAAFEYLQREVLATEWRIVVKLRNQGVTHEEVMLCIERELDLDSVRIGG